MLGKNITQNFVSLEDVLRELAGGGKLIITLTPDYKYRGEIIEEAVLIAETAPTVNELLFLLENSAEIWLLESESQYQIDTQ